MAEAIIGGLIKAGVPAVNISVSDLDVDKLQATFGDWGITTTTDNAELVDTCEVILLAVKPQVMHSVLEPLAIQLKDKQPLLISIAAGIPISLIQQWSGYSAAVVRVMPNTPALVRAGAAGLFASEQVNESQREVAQSIMQAVGVAIWVESEGLIDSITAVSGSGPAYFFYLIEALEAAAIKNGLKVEDARLLSRETALGAAKLAAQSEFSAAELRKRVTSPGGTTAAAIEVMTKNDFSETINLAVRAAADRARELAELAESN